MEPGREGGKWSGHLEDVRKPCLDTRSGREERQKEQLWLTVPAEQAALCPQKALPAPAPASAQQGLQLKLSESRVDWVGWEGVS